VAPRAGRSWAQVEALNLRIDNFEILSHIKGKAYAVISVEEGVVSDGSINISRILILCLDLYTV
jgi:hypothetical protein